MGSRRILQDNKVKDMIHVQKIRETIQYYLGKDRPYDILVEQPDENHNVVISIIADIITLDLGIWLDINDALLRSNLKLADVKLKMMEAHAYRPIGLPATQVDIMFPVHRLQEKYIIPASGLEDLLK